MPQRKGSGRSKAIERSQESCGVQRGIEQRIPNSQKPHVALALTFHQSHKAGLLHVNRNNNGIASVHPFRGPELRALRRLKRDEDAGPYVFMTERRGSMTTDNVRKLVQRAGQEARLAFPVHPQMLRHACGYKLSNDGHDTRAIQHYLGHKNIQNTVRTHNSARQ